MGQNKLNIPIYTEIYHWCGVVTVSLYHAEKAKVVHVSRIHYTHGVVLHKNWCIWHVFTHINEGKGKILQQKSLNRWCRLCYNLTLELTERFWGPEPPPCLHRLDFIDIRYRLWHIVFVSTRCRYVHCTFYVLTAWAALQLDSRWRSIIRT